MHDNENENDNLARCEAERAELLALLQEARDVIIGSFGMLVQVETRAPDNLAGAIGQFWDVLAANGHDDIGARLDKVIKSATDTRG